jgi:hypothetical protein
MHGIWMENADWMASNGYIHGIWVEDWLIASVRTLKRPATTFKYCKDVLSWCFSWSVCEMGRTNSNGFFWNDLLVTHGILFIYIYAYIYMWYVRPIMSTPTKKRRTLYILENVFSRNVKVTKCKVQQRSQNEYGKIVKNKLEKQILYWSPELCQWSL